MILQLTSAVFSSEGDKVWINNKFIEALIPSYFTKGATLIHMSSGKEYIVCESPEEIVKQIP